MRGRTKTVAAPTKEQSISIHLPRAGQDTKQGRHFLRRHFISIHLPRAGQDVRMLGNAMGEFTISIHLPRAGQDPLPSGRAGFLSYFNPPAPCGAGHGSLPTLLWRAGISIHLPRAGQDADGRSVQHEFSISIHLPRAGQDAIGVCERRRKINFNPPAPCGAGHRTTDERILL